MLVIELNNTKWSNCCQNGHAQTVLRYVTAVDQGKLTIVKRDCIIYGSFTKSLKGFQMHYSQRIFAGRNTFQSL